MRHGYLELFTDDDTVIWVQVLDDDGNARDLTGVMAELRIQDTTGHTISETVQPDLEVSAFGFPMPRFVTSTFALGLGQFKVTTTSPLGVQERVADGTVLILEGTP